MADGLYVCESKSCGIRVSSKLGKGLHTMDKLYANTLVGEFHGTIITVEEYEVKELEGKGGYGIGLRGREGFVLDCYEQCMRGECWMSRANTARNSHSWKRGPQYDMGISLVKNRNNCQARQDGDRVRLYVGDRNIQPFSELFWAYGPTYDIYYE